VTQQDPPGEKSNLGKTDSPGLLAPARPAQSAESARANGEGIDAEYEVLREAVRPAHGPRMLRAAPATRLAASEGAAHGSLTGDDARDALAGWGHAHGQSPAPRHRRRLILKWVKPLTFADCLDAGCGDGELLRDIVRQGRSLDKAIAGFGCDVALDDALVRQRDPAGCSFLKIDPLLQSWPGGRQFELVICSEVLGNASQWRPALANLIRMTRRYLLLTVPAGPMRMADRVAGHQHHFDGLELAGAVVGHGLTLLKQRRWGFPINNLYQSTLDHLPAGLGAGHPGDTSSLPMRLVAEGLYLAFFSNDLFHGGTQQILLAERKDGIGH
jgi:SAM-dependent methyltransferase